MLLLRPLEHAFDDLVLVDLNLQDHIDRRAEIEEHVSQNVRLLDRARVAVQQEAVGGVWGGQASLHHRVRHRIGHELSAVHVRLGLLADLGSFRHVRAEDVTGRDGGDVEALRDARGLRSLARSGRAEEDDDCHLRNPS